MPACAVLDDYQGAARRFGDWDRFAGRLDIRIYSDHFETDDEVVAAVSDCVVVVIMRERTAFGRGLFARLPNLKLLATTGRKNAAIDLAAAAEHGVTVCSTGSFPTGTAELTWGLILSLARHIPHEYGNLRAGGRWQSTVGMDLCGRKLGIIGLGSIGEQVARTGKAFGMQVQAWSRNLSADRCEATGVEFCSSLDALLSTSEIITIHVPLSERTRGLIGDAELRRMKPSALLVNTSRGPIVDEAALIDALVHRRITGAGLDVYDREPLPPDHPFRRLDNVVATPHIGYVTEETYRVYFGDVVANIAAWLDGKSLRVLTG